MALASLPVPTVVSTFTHLEHSLRVRSFDSGKAPVLVGRATTLTWVIRHFEHQFAGLSLAFAAVVLELPGTAECLIKLAAAAPFSCAAAELGVAIQAASASAAKARAMYLGIWISVFIWSLYWFLSCRQSP